MYVDVRTMSGFQGHTQKRILKISTLDGRNLDLLGYSGRTRNHGTC